MAYKAQNDRQKSIIQRYEDVKDKMVEGLLSQGMEEVETVRTTTLPTNPPPPPYAYPHIITP